MSPASSRERGFFMHQRLEPGDKRIGWTKLGRRAELQPGILSVVLANDSRFDRNFLLFTLLFAAGCHGFRRSHSSDFRRLRLVLISPRRFPTFPFFPFTPEGFAPH